jgi:hypothetical protein
VPSAANLAIHRPKVGQGRRGAVSRRFFGAGYVKVSDYLAIGLSNFTGMCLSYSNTYLDPVCGMYGLYDLTGANIKLHETGYQTSGLAARLGGILAGYAKQ